MKIVIALLLLTTAALAESSVMVRPVLVIPPPEPLPPPFETPSWVPDEATKLRALKRGYELNGNSMVGSAAVGSIDVSQDPIVTGRIVITPETEFNVLDATPVVSEKQKEKKRK